MKILHTADWHLREAHLSMTERGEDFFKAAAATVDIARTHQAECMVAVGDLLNEGRPSSKVISQLRTIHDSAQAAQLPVFCVLGNHDASSPSWYKQVVTTTAGAQYDGLIDITNKVTQFRGVWFVGLPAVEGHDLPAHIAELGGKVPVGEEVVWLWHGAVREFVGFPSEKYVSLAELTEMLNTLPALKHKAFLMGDIHETGYAVMPLITGPCTIGYPGATELVKRNDQLHHTVTIIDLGAELSPEGSLQMSVVPVPHRPAVAFRLYTADQILALKALVAPVWDMKPIVLISYAASLTNAVELVQAHLDPDKCFLRMAAMPDIPNLQEGWHMFEDAAGKLRTEGRPVVAEVLAEFVPSTHPAYELGQRLVSISGGQKPVELVDLYVRERLDALAASL
jgi:hypothetical protein